MNRSNLSLSVAALFAGVGGIELGLERSGHSTNFFCEIDDLAKEVLRQKFQATKIHSDITTLRRLPKVDLVTAGFPCQDISLAGTRHGLKGTQSGLVDEFFRLIEKSKPELILLENVSNLLRLNKGASMVQILNRLESLKYKWAYRLVDTRGFGLPQRRLRVFILGSRGPIAPEQILFGESVVPVIDDSISRLEFGRTYGFYWTEGKRGVGWARDAVPTIKGGSGLGIPSPPAIFNPLTGLTGTPTISDAERLQGFEAGWTDIEVNGAHVREGARWKMVGNAVSVPAAEWIGNVLAHAIKSEVEILGQPFDPSRPMPIGAFGSASGRFAVETTTHVFMPTHLPIKYFLHDPLKPLSNRALTGYIQRAMSGDKKFPVGFIDALQAQAAA